jgi:hypothetical protein
LGPHSRRKHERKETLPISLFHLCPNILQPHCEFEPEFLLPPLQILSISLERNEGEKNMWKQLVHGEEDPNTKFKEQCRSHVVKDFCEINIKKYFWNGAKGEY